VIGKWHIAKCIKVVSALEDLAEISRVREHVKAIIRIVEEICGDYYLEYPQLAEVVRNLKINLKS
jgi:hypothetical protein